MKVKDLYDIESFNDAIEKTKLFDGQAGILLPRQLEYVVSTIYEQKYSNLSFLTGVKPKVDNSGGYADYITKTKVDFEGDFTEMGRSSDSDGRISLSGEGDSLRVYGHEAYSKWSEFEFEQAKLANMNLVQQHVKAHNKRYLQIVDEIAYVGKGGTEGLFNYAGFTTTSATSAFSSLSAAAIYTELSRFINLQRSAVSSDDSPFACNILVVSPTIYRLLSTTLYVLGGATDNVMNVIKKNHNVDFVSTSRAGNKILAISNDEQAFVFRIPMPLKISNIAKIANKSLFESMFRIGGVDVIADEAGYVLVGV